MNGAGRVLWSVLTVSCVVGYEYGNGTIEPAYLQLLEFRNKHPAPIGVWTTSAGAPVDVRDALTINSDIFNNEIHLDTTMHLDAERIPERVVHAKGGGAFGYFEVTNDVSKYTSADVFNGIGKKTPIVARFSSVGQNLGGNDLAREMKGLGVKFYTKEGNLDLVAIDFPVYFYKDPIFFNPFAHCFKRNPKTFLFDFNTRWDWFTKRPLVMHGILWLLSDYGIPDGYRRMDAFPVHTFEVSNKHGDSHFVRFNFRTEQGLANLTNAQAREIGDPDYYNRDLFNAIEDKDYPSWRLEMDVMSKEDITRVNYNPFDVSRMWKKGDYHTVTIGRMVLNKNPDNFFKDLEQSIFNPGNIVPGIPGPPDFLYKARKLAYRDTQNYRLGINHNKIEVNMPRYAKTYIRNGVRPVNDNMKDAPNYYPNAFNGPVPYVDESRPNSKLIILESNAVDFQPAADFYNEYVKDEGHRQRLINNTIETFEGVYPELINRVVRLYSLIDEDLGRRLKDGLRTANLDKKGRKPKGQFYDASLTEELLAQKSRKHKY